MSLINGKTIKFYFGDLETVGTCQKETATVVGTIGISGAGNATVIVTAAGMGGSPKTLSVAVANNDTASQVAEKIRTALEQNSSVSAFFLVSGAAADIVLTARNAAANDATMNISIDNGTCTGLTAALSSANTVAGVAGSGKPPEIEITGFTPNVQFDESQTTTSSTTGDGKAVTLIRKKVSAKVESILKDGGAEITGNTLAMTVGGAAVPITKVDYGVAYDEHKITNASSPAGAHEFGAVRAERKGKLDVYMEDGADLALGNTAFATVITLATGHTITGSAKFRDKSPVGDVNEFTKNSYGYTFQGEPAEVGIGLVAGVKKDCLIEFVEDGKSISGKAIIFTKDVSSEVDKEVKLSYGITFTGAVTEV